MFPKEQRLKLPWGVTMFSGEKEAQVSPQGNIVAP